jgi:VanZ family protein
MLLWQRMRRRAAHEITEDSHLSTCFLVCLTTLNPMRFLRENCAVRWAAVVAWMGLIFYLSAQPRLPLVLPPGFPQIQDVIGHFTVYAVLVVLLWWALRGTGVRRPQLWALAVTVLYSFTDEFHQSFVPNRHPDVFDLATDLAGAVTALVIVWRLGAHRGRA